jgi:hypothetical protein
MRNMRNIFTGGRNKRAQRKRTHESFQFFGKRRENVYGARNLPRLPLEKKDIRKKEVEDYKNEHPETINTYLP